MEHVVTLHLDADTEERLAQLAGMLGASKELAALYAVRLVSACVREGLIRDVPPCIWPGEAQALCATQNRVLPLKRAPKREKPRAGHA